MKAQNTTTKTRRRRREKSKHGKSIISEGIWIVNIAAAGCCCRAMELFYDGILPAYTNFKVYDLKRADSRQSSKGDASEFDVK
jgi:hypothetical protein